MEVNTINGRYYILFDENQRKGKRCAHYIASPFATWHSGENTGIYNHDSYFTLKNIDVFEIFDGLNIGRASFKEMQNVCDLNDWKIKYS